MRPAAMRPLAPASDRTRAEPRSGVPTRINRREEASRCGERHDPFDAAGRARPMRPVPPMPFSSFADADDKQDYATIWGGFQPMKASRKVPKKSHKVRARFSLCHAFSLQLSYVIKYVSAGCAVSGGRFLPESCRLVIAEHARLSASAPVATFGPPPVVER